jgi:hypothetical protein
MSTANANYVGKLPIRLAVFEPMRTKAGVTGCLPNGPHN